MDAEMRAVSHSLVVELAGSIGLRNSRIAQSVIWPIFRPVTDRLAHVGLTFDRSVLQSGLSRAMRFTLEDFVTGVTVHGMEAFPPEGPLLVISNHPGTYDSLVVASQLRRDDLNFITGDIPFLRTLSHANRYFYCISDEVNGRMLAARKAIRHLKAGGAMLLYGFGHIDPDPEVYPDAASYLEQWSPSIDLFLKAAPNTRILVVIVSGVVSKKWRDSLLYQLRSDPVDRRRLVEFGQVSYQLLFPRRLMTSPCISFSRPVGVDELLQESGTGQVLPAVIALAKTLLGEHMGWVKTLKR